MDQVFLCGQIICISLHQKYLDWWCKLCLICFWPFGVHVKLSVFIPLSPACPSTPPAFTFCLIEGRFMISLCLQICKLWTHILFVCWAIMKQHDYGKKNECRGRERHLDKHCDRRARRTLMNHCAQVLILFNPFFFKSCPSFWSLRSFPMTVDVINKLKTGS